MGYPWGDCFKLLLLTGCRRAEIAEARWSEFDKEARVLRIPAERVKANGQNVATLSDAAMNIILSVPRFEGGQYILSASGPSPIAGHADAKARLDRLMAEELGCHPRFRQRRREGFRGARSAANSAHQAGCAQGRLHRG
jgi:integrase